MRGPLPVSQEAYKLAIVGFRGSDLADTDLTGRLIAQRFLISERLGSGGMGTVWRARDLQLQRPCVIKTLHRTLIDDPELRTRFVREALAAAAIRSRHVLGFIAADVDPGDGSSPPLPFLAMELLDGRDLEQRLTQDGPMGREETIVVLRQVARALDKAHGMGIVHRDIKPENIFLAHEDGETVVKVLDFGVAKLVPDMTSDSIRFTHAGALVGSPLYMAPEQFLDASAVDYRADLWSLGLVCFRMLSGMDYWSATELLRLAQEICLGPMPAASERSQGRIPTSVDAWLSRALNRNPEGRFESATQMVEALARALDVATLATALQMPQAPALQRSTLRSPTPPLVTPRALDAQAAQRVAVAQAAFGQLEQQLESYRSGGTQASSAPRVKRPVTELDSTQVSGDFLSIVPSEPARPAGPNWRGWLGVGLLTIGMLGLGGWKLWHRPGLAITVLPNQPADGLVVPGPLSASPLPPPPAATSVQGVKQAEQPASSVILPHPERGKTKPSPSAALSGLPAPSSTSPRAVQPPATSSVSAPRSSGSSDDFSTLTRQ